MKKVDLLRFTQLDKVFRPFFSGEGHVIVLHRVGYENTTFYRDLQVSPEYLESVIRFFIEKNIDIITLHEVYQRITSGRRSGRFVAFTFDDGYLDNMEIALPVFEKYNVPFTIFLTTGYPDSKLFLWGQMLEKIVLKQKSIAFSDGDKDYFFSTETISQKRESFFKIKRYLRESHENELNMKLRSVLGENYFQLAEYTKKATLSWDQVVKLSNHSLVQIEAHSVHHKALSGLNIDEVKREIGESVERIEKMTNQKVHYFAYPFGGPNEAGPREYGAVEGSNLRMAFTAINGNLFRRHASYLYSLPRIGLHENWSMSHIELYVNGFTPFIDRFR